MNDTLVTPAHRLNGQLSAVLFDGDALVLAEHNAQPYVVMRALVTAMGLDWASQYVKLTDKFGSTVVEITTVAEDGKPRSMVCLPLRKLPGWLYSLNAGKVRPSLRAKVLRYQAECDEVLWRHWTRQAPLHSQHRLSLTEQAGLLKRRAELRKELAACPDALAAADAYVDYLHVSQLLALAAGPIDALTPALRQHLLPGV